MKNIFVIIIILAIATPIMAQEEQDICISITNELASYPFSKCKNVKDRSTCKPISDVVWRDHCGICGERTCAMLEKLKDLGIEARYVGMFGLNYLGVTNATHAMVEAKYDGSWHLFCPSFGVYFMDGGRVLSLKEMLTEPNRGREYGTPERTQMFRKNFFKIWTSIVYGYDEYKVMQNFMRIR